MLCDRRPLNSIPAKKVQDSVDVPGLITACGFTLDGKTACAGTYAGALYLYDTNKLAYKSSIAVRSSKGKNAKGRKITGIEAVYAPAGGHDRLLVTSNDSRIRVYNLRDKGLERKYKGTYTNTTSQIRATISDCGQFVVSGSEDRCVYVWSYSDGEKQHKEGAQEYFYGSTSGTVTCAVMAPLVTHRHLLESEDPIQLHAKLTEQGPVVDGANWNGASAISLPSSVSSSTSSPKLESPSPPQVPSLDPRMNRIICSVDDDECIKVWRTDSYGVFGPQMPGTPATPNTPYSLGPYSGRTHAASVSSVATSNSRNSAHSREE